jgi:hypothetical protein
LVRRVRDNSEQQGRSAGSNGVFMSVFLSVCLRVGVCVGVYSGLYFSPHADYTLFYANGVKQAAAGQRLQILCFSVLPGRVQQLSELQTGQPKHPNYHSNRSTNGYELILFDSRFCLPVYVLDVQVAAAPGAKFSGSQEQKGH